MYISCSVASDFSVTPWTVAHQASLSMGFPRQEYCSGLPFPSPVVLPDPGIKPKFPALEADTLPPEPPRGTSGKERTANAEGMRDMGSIPGSGRSSGGGHGSLLQYSCLGNPIDRGACSP